MDAFSYTNIFDTKGIEYLIIIGFLILVIPFWRALNRPIKAKYLFRDAVGALKPEMLRIPRGLHYASNHMWTHLRKSGYARVGIDDLLLKLVGQVELENFMNPGERVKKGDIIARLKQGDKQLTIQSPISGEINEVNSKLKKNSGMIYEDPYGLGWIYDIKPDDWNNDIYHAATSDRAKEWSENELQRFKDFLAKSLKTHSNAESALILQEGGELTQYPLSGMSAEVWEEFDKSFLNSGV